MAVSADELISSIEQMTVLELNELVKALQERFGVSAAVPMAAAPAAAGGDGAGAAAEVEEQTAFDVILTGAGANKIQVIKAVREVVPGLGLKEAKDLVDGAPSPIREGVPRDEAESIRAKLVEQGATVDIK